METIVVLDTHVVTWLAAGKASHFSARSKRILDKADRLLVSPMVTVELYYLWEIRRLGLAPDDIMVEVQKSMGVELATASIGAGVQQAKNQSWTRDPFDRLIVAHAAIGDDTLVTKDENILAHYPLAAW